MNSQCYYSVEHQKTPTKTPKELQEQPHEIKAGNQSHRMWLKRDEIRDNKVISKYTQNTGVKEINT